jgi:hypothetical protein
MRSRLAVLRPVAIAVALIGAAATARAQHIESFHIEPAMPSAAAPSMEMPSVASPIEVAPVEAAPVQAAPVEAAPAITVEVPPPPEQAGEEAEDCDIHETQCTRSCDPLPSEWSGYHACLRYECSRTSENCIEKLAKALESRDNSDDDDDNDDP